MKNIQINSLSIKRGLSVVFILISFVSMKAQVNYVQNPSFEMYDTCPNTIGQINYAHYWTNLVDHSGGTPDFLHTCANTDTFVGVPENILGYQMPKTGLGYSLLGLFEYIISQPNIGAREYMNNKLKGKLIANKNYCVKAYLSLCEAGYCGVDGFGFYFDNGTFVNIGVMGTNVNPQIENPSMNIIMDSIGWVEISGTFIADGTEEYITLGNFKNNANTHYIPTPNEPGIGFYVAGYYIDDVSVIESDLPAFAGNDTALQAIGDSLFLGRPPEIGLECTWYNWAGDSIGSGAGIWVKPSHTQPYIVEQNLCGIITRDTVYVSMGTAIENAGALQGLRVYPNPCQGTFQLSIPDKIGEVINLRIFEISGRKVYEQPFELKEQPLEVLTALSSGLYLLYVEDSKTGVSIVRKLAVE